MKIFHALLGGLAGAASVTILHEIIRHQYTGAPRLDRLGMQAMKKSIEQTGHNAPSGKALYAGSLTGDLIANALYYGVIATRPHELFKTGVLVGAAAGVGAITLPEPLGLDPDYSAATRNRKAITLGLYTLGGIIAAGVIKQLESKKQ